MKIKQQKNSATYFKQTPSLPLEGLGVFCEVLLSIPQQPIKPLFRAKFLRFLKSLKSNLLNTTISKHDFSVLPQIKGTNQKEVKQNG
ncbi:hypothetical protein CGZ90_10045 [Fictibacillus aquaticus]|uniref:Uncharacterized protein n=1 Tax=Fictibacillus aquaticus TaxID=2021314 RepID=A0A235FAB3_9BACL|nr:hypothetical protein CGZ90_10045 [Fictibacillus aquaticus]